MISATKIPAWIWKTSKGLRTQAVLNAIVEVLLVGLDFTFIWATKRAVDIATGRLAGSLFWTCAVLIAIMVCKVFISFVRRWIAAILGVRSQNQMQLRLFDRLMRSIWSGKETHHSGDVLNRLEKDVGDVTSIITETIPAAFGVIVRFLGAFIFFFQMDFPGSMERGRGRPRTGRCAYQVEGDGGSQEKPCMHVCRTRDDHGRIRKRTKRNRCRCRQAGC